ncbi:hypothetical protein GCM10010449_31950 [Streptomyces rectiviolaceus]|uniref:Secreted protein n=1 Tax=Streptomyces rectiviolaceus TaxID=332591 RepID=A0ABP6MER4_9ACTN
MPDAATTGVEVAVVAVVLLVVVAVLLRVMVAVLMMGSFRGHANEGPGRTVCSRPVRRAEKRTAAKGFAKKMEATELQSLDTRRKKRRSAPAPQKAAYTRAVRKVAQLAGRRA